MGLDMYLYARRRVTDDVARTITEKMGDGDPDYLPRWQHTSAEKAERTNAVIALAGLTPLLGEEPNHASVTTDENGTEVRVCAVYWRKANAVHAWFVDNVQGGEDECNEFDVHPEALGALALMCERAKAAYDAGNLDEAAAIMAPREGFFFGGTEIDEWWAGDLVETSTEIRRVVAAAIAVGGVTFSYRSSW